MPAIDQPGRSVRRPRLPGYHGPFRRPAGSVGSHRWHQLTRHFAAARRCAERVVLCGADPNGPHELGPRSECDRATGIPPCAPSHTNCFRRSHHDPLQPSFRCAHQLAAHGRIRADRGRGGSGQPFSRPPDNRGQPPRPTCSRSWIRVYVPRYASCATGCVSARVILPGTKPPRSRRLRCSRPRARSGSGYLWRPCSYSPKSPVGFLL